MGDHNRHLFDPGWEPPEDEPVCGTARAVACLAAVAAGLIVAGLASGAVVGAWWLFEQAARAWGL